MADGVAQGALIKHEVLGIVPDIVDPETRSRMMSAIRNKDTKPELQVRRYLHRRGFRYKLHVKGMPGSPDIVLARYRTVVFVHGCFWHQHEGCKLAAKPDTNSAFWHIKLRGNVDRDQRSEAALRDAGWQSLTVWECELGDLSWLPGRILLGSVS